ncbi:threonine ammonia-lyase [Butyrivibrio sp. FCS006]|uniref:threonine ammonia-lyase n=1 Tax=Butyrivibrio sp. FCS006 TaxID=1280684 RepID=UPI0004069A2D|nr:threonine ammonia-lyase [Butyrivibrio sp. FCS006]
MADENKMTLDKFEEAYEDVKKVTLDTKLIYSDYWSSVTGGKVYLKPENLQRTGAYKVRGAYYKITTLTDEERSKGLITASAGNHAQGVAYAAKQYGVKAVICMPTSTPLIKVNRTKALGAEVVLYGDVYDEAYQKALELAKEHGYTLVHPFDDLDVATGQGTIAMEIIKELPTVDVILVPIGGGGLATGVSTLAKLLNPKIKVIGVEPAGANCMQESFKAGHVVTLPSVNTIADGTAVKTPGEHIFPYLRKNIDEIITVPDEDLVVSFLDMVENHKMVVENSGLLSVAALKQLDLKDKKVACVLSGGNMDIITMSSVVQQGLIMRDRIFTVSVLLPDKPGELSRVSGIIAEVKGNVIKLEHNQFVSINRNAAVELRITLEAFGTEHKEQIMNALNDNGYKPRIVRTNI